MTREEQFEMFPIGAICYHTGWHRRVRVLAHADNVYLGGGNVTCPIKVDLCFESDEMVPDSFREGIWSGAQYLQSTMTPRGNSF